MIKRTWNLQLCNRKECWQKTVTKPPKRKYHLKKVEIRDVQILRKISEKQTSVRNQRKFLKWVTIHSPKNRASETEVQNIGLTYMKEPNSRKKAVNQS